MLFLRSFRNDVQTHLLRCELQNALGRQFRVSGIRDPRRRHSWVHYLGLIVFILRYSTPKFMNLEAGRDWKLRLCQSMLESKLVVVDASDVTQHVAVEISLAAQSVGLSRILFIATERVDVTDGKQVIKEHLPIHANHDDINIVFWDDSSGLSRSEFRTKVQVAAMSACNSTEKIDPRSISFSSNTMCEDEPVAMNDWKYFLGAYFVIFFPLFFLSLVLSFFDPLLSERFERLFAAISSTAVCVLFIQYLLDIGSLRQRFSVFVALGICGLWYYAVFSSIGRAGESVKSNISKNNLRQVGLALHEFADSKWSLPPGEFTNTQESARSWLTDLLPYSEHSMLYFQLDLSKPWNHDVNGGVFRSNVDIFQSPGVRMLADHKGYSFSHYAGNQLAFGGKNGMAFNDFSDGTGSTFVAGEVEDHFRPWGDPDNIRHPSVGIKSGPMSFGRFAGPYAILLMADGSAKSVSSQIDPKVFEALGTPNGGEDTSSVLRDW